jgi:nitrate/nitrite-specific signal transduction histidine kinase
LKRIDGFFGLQAQPAVVKLAQGSYHYASIAPITGTDWSVVIFCNTDSLSGVTHLLPLSLVLLSALFLYVAASNVMMRQLIITPLNRLTQCVSKADADAVEMYGSDRDDEIGELARTILEMWDRLSAYNAELLHATHERQRQARLLHAVNSAAAALLTTVDEKNFEAALLEGMELIGRCMDVEHVSIWRNETVDGALYYELAHAWLSDVGLQGKTLPIKTRLPYGGHPEWEGKLLRGECIHGPLIALSRDAQTLLRPYGVRSVLIIPIHLQERFWGFVRFDDCLRDRAFTEVEVSILRSASLMMVNAIHRNAQATVHTAQML